MGICGCASPEADMAVRLPDGSIVALSVYPGCPDCEAVVGVTLYGYIGNETDLDCWVPCEQQDLTLDGWGGNEGAGVSMPLLDVDDLVEAASAIERAGNRVSAYEDPGGETEGDYESVRDWMKDHGLALLQDTLRRTARRWAAIKDGR